MAPANPSPRTAPGGSLWTRQPFFALYTILTVAKALIQIPGLAILYLIPTFRPHRKWTWQTGIACAALRLFSEYSLTVELKPPFTHDPGAEKDRFVIIDPLPNQPDQPSLYKGLPFPSPSIAPIPIACVWFPAAPPTKPTYTHKPGTKIFLHFHGGAFVIGSPRDSDMFFGAKALLAAAGPDARIFAPQYRLASYEGGRFPAALQDGVTAYAHLVKRLDVPARDVILSGDSAGGNLALGVLRHVVCNLSREDGLPEPGGVLLWSPWTDVGVSVDELKGREEARRDFIPPDLARWTVRTFLPEGEEAAVEHPFVSPVRQAIVTRTPIWVQWGAEEVLADDIRRWVEVQSAAGGGGRVGVCEIPLGVHDLLLAWGILGFGKEMEKAVAEGLKFLEEGTDSKANG